MSTTENFEHYDIFVALIYFGLVVDAMVAVWRIKVL